MPSIKNPFERILCLYVCAPDPQKVIGIMKNVRGNVPKKNEKFQSLKFHDFCNSRGGREVTLIKTVAKIYVSKIM